MRFEIVESDFSFLSEVPHGFLDELHVERHELCDECLEVVDGLVALAQAMLVLGGQTGHLGLQLTVAVLHQLAEEAAGIKGRKKKRFDLSQRKLVVK